MKRKGTRRLRQAATGSLVGAGAIVSMFSFGVHSAGASCSGPASGQTSWTVLAEGGKATMNVTAGATAADWMSGGHVNQTLWVYQKLSIPQYWVEIGWTKGIHHTNDLDFYWAEQTPFGYSDFVIGPAAVDPANPHVFEIFESGGSEGWVAQIDGNTYGSAPVNPDPSVFMAAGAEATDCNSHLGITGAAGLQFKSGGSWQPGWLSTLSSSSTGYSGWVTPGSYEYDGVN